MKTGIGCLLMLIGLALGLYVGVWLCLIGGVIQIIESCKMNPIDSMGVAIGIARFLFASVAGYGSFAIPALIGNVLIQDK